MFTVCLFSLVDVDWGHSLFSIRFSSFCIWCDSSRLVIASATSRWRWLPKGLLCKIEYLKELLPWAKDTFSNSTSRSSPLLVVPSLMRARVDHSIVKLNTMCDQKKSSFGKLHHQNGSKFYQMFFMSRYTQYL